MRLTASVASSSENIHIAHAIQRNLASEIEVTYWDQSDPTGFVLDDLTAELMRADFGIFVFTPDDKTEIREASTRSVRDNILFELGLFIGRFGRERAFIVTPRGHQDIRIPTDILGLNLIKYDSDRIDRNWTAALASACHQCSDQASITASATTVPAGPGKSIAAPAEKEVPGLSRTINNPARSGSRYV